MEADVVRRQHLRQAAPVRFVGAVAPVREPEALRSIPAGRVSRAAAELPVEVAELLVLTLPLPAVAIAAVRRSLRRELIRLLPAVTRLLPGAAAVAGLPFLPVVTEADAPVAEAIAAADVPVVAAVAEDKRVVG